MLPGSGSMNVVIKEESRFFNIMSFIPILGSVAEELSCTVRPEGLTAQIDLGNGG